MYLKFNPNSTCIPPHLTKKPSTFFQKNRPSLVNFTVAKRRCDLYDLHKELVPYPEAWSLQKDIRKEKIVLTQKSEDFSDSLIVLQHHPVYTLGTASSEEFLNFDIKDSPIDIYRTERAGEVTYHGPGQLLMYPIINLRYHKMSARWYLRALEEVVIRALSSTFAIEASRVEGLTGVWVGNQKLAFIGIRVSSWITCNGLALNVTTDLTPFQQIVPCGIRDCQVGSIKGLLNENSLSKGFTHLLDDDELIDITHRSLIREFCEVFQVDLQYKSVQIGVSREKINCNLPH